MYMEERNNVRDGGRNNDKEMREMKGEKKRQERRKGINIDLRGGKIGEREGMEEAREE